MENKNFFLAIILSVGFLAFWSLVVMPRFAPKANLKDAVTTAANPSTATSASAPTIAGGAATTPTPAGAASSEKEVSLTNADNVIVLSSLGGGIKHWRLQSKGKEVDLVEHSDVTPLPLATLPATTFDIKIQKESALMTGQLSNGLRVTKTLTLDPTGHLHTLTLTLVNPTNRTIDLKDWAWGWGPGLGTTPAEKKENEGMIRALTKNKLKAHPLKPGVYPDFGEWAAIDNRYFLVAFLPVSGDKPTLRVDGTKDKTVVQVYQPVSLGPDQKKIFVYQIYAGPKGYTQLGKYKKNLEAAVDFGMFSGLGKLILRAIYWLQHQTGNYGWAIVIFTVILQILLFPLTIKSFKATLAMKRLQPQIAVLQASYKGDPKRLNLEMMNLYKKSGTNPFGGCLPMLLQLPIFWALFTTLRNAYELQGAPFAGWIHDLSVADPLHVLPVVMGIGMFFQQRMAGAVTDPTQKQMMMIMPVMFTVMFFNFPAGLVLYWFTQNVMTLAIQGVLMQRHSKPAIEVIR